MSRQTQAPEGGRGRGKEGPGSKIKALSEVRAGPRVVQMFKEVSAERAVRVCAQRVCAL